MLYTISKLRKSTIQCFKRCAIRSWNKEVAAIASQSLRAEGSILQSAAKSPFYCEVIPQPFCTVWCISFWSCPTYTARRKLGTSRWKPTSQPYEDSLLLRSDFAALLSVCEISQTPFSPAKWFLKLPDTFAPTLLDLFFRYFWYNFHFLLVFNHSCNSLTRKCPRKGKLPSYINSLASTVKRRSEKYVI